MKRTDNLENLGQDGRLVLKSILNRAWIGNQQQEFLNKTKNWVS